MPAPLAKQTAEQARKLLDRCKIDAPFINCPDCFDVEQKRSLGYYKQEHVAFVCETCAGTGRLYFKEQPQPTVVLWLQSVNWHFAWVWGFLIAVTVVTVRWIVVKVW